jgi:hypothetical protein
MLRGIMLVTSGAIKAGHFALDKLSETAHPDNDLGELEKPLMSMTCGS